MAVGTCFSEIGDGSWEQASDTYCNGNLFGVFKVTESFITGN